MKTKLGLILLMAIALVSCGNRNAKKAEENKDAIEETNHFEDSEVAYNVVNIISCSDSTVRGYLIFAADSSTVEVTLPEGTIILEKRTNGRGEYVWNVEDDDTILVEKRYNNKWVVSRRETVLYVSE